MWVTGYLLVRAALVSMESTEAPFDYAEPRTLTRAMPGMFTAARGQNGAGAGEELTRGARTTVSQMRTLVAR